MTTLRVLAAGTVLAFAASAGVIALLNIRVVFEPPLLLPVLTVLFVGLPLFVVAAIATRTYLDSRSPIFLMMGCGVLVLGACALVSAWLMALAGRNVAATIYYVGALASSIFHAVSAITARAEISGREGPRPKTMLLASYLGVVGFTALLSISAFQGVVPRFVQGVEPALLSRAMLGTAAALFALSSAIFTVRYRRTSSSVLFWYSMALTLTTVSLSALSLQPAVGSPLGWTSRWALYVGDFYFLGSVLTAMRSSRNQAPQSEIQSRGLYP